MTRPLVIPFFIAHQGCPHRCVFCNQHAITGQSAGSFPDVARLGQEIAASLARPRRAERGRVQVAFYGGSFTCLPAARQRELLGAVRPFLAEGVVDEIRLSTRPDYINVGIVDFLKRHGVGTVELGIQSMSDQVLRAGGRGHTVEDSERAIECVRGGGLKVGVQLMVGLPGDRPGLLFKGAAKLAAMRPDLVRIYPTVVLRGSGLERRYRAGEYRPMSLARAVAVSGRVKEIFDGGGVRVVRIGLQATDTIQDDIVAGPYHPAFGEMVLSRNLYRKVRSALAAAKESARLELRVAAADQSVLRGPGNVNLKRLAAKGLFDNVDLIFEDDRRRGTVAVAAG
ncbi:MAG: radical SAM protein [Desulfurivibrionaceae bacterium]|nr:radical SAM protein [Desulfobulbales bacterium]MDT8335694.1 radical SAM protein [Desulfurivibrionaceae bacterium]